MSPVRRPLWLRYGAAVLSIAAGVALRIALDPILADGVPFITLFAAVAFSAWFGGRGAGFLSIVLGILAADYFIVEPRNSFKIGAPEYLAGALLYAAMCGVIILLIHALRRAERRVELSGQTLAPQAERLALALDAGRLGVWEWNLVDNTVWWSDNLEEIHGLPRGAFHGTLEGFQRIIHPDDRERVDQAIARALEQRSDYEIEFRALKPDGGYLWIGGKAKVFTDPQGRPLRMVGSAMDVTDRRRVNDALRGLLRVSQRLNSSLDLEGILAVLVEEATRLVDAEGGSAGLQPTGEMSAWVFEHKVPWLSEDGSTICVPILDSSGEALGFFEVHDKRDGSRITASSQERLVAMSQTAAIAIQNALAYRSLHEARAALEEADGRKDEFLATLAHELRSPLAPITNSLEILRLTDHGDGASETRNARSVMERQVRHMVRLIDDLMDVNRITRNKLELRRARVELRRVLESAIETTGPLLTGGARRFTTSIPDEPVWLDADITRLAQVFSNLLNNAVKFTRQGGNIGLTVTRKDGEVAVTVADDGVGIAPEDQGKLFDLFVQVSSPQIRAQTGLGIGLALARRLVEMHDGRLEAHSNGLGHGSEFVVHLPMARTSPE